MLFFSAIVTFLFAVTSAAEQAKGPSIYIENANRDVGTVTQGETIKQVFQFENKGDRILEILEVMHS